MKLKHLYQHYFQVLVKMILDINYGASMHLSFHKEWFRDYERIPPIKIYMGDDLVQ
jgi:hypothetical protein